MDLQLTGKRALVTGSNSGIGKGIARMLIEEGCQVVIHGRDRERAETTAAELGAAGFAIGDLTSDEGADHVCEAAVEALGGVDVLVNNAGGAVGSSATTDFFGVGVDAWLDTFQKNTTAAVRLNLRLVPAMVDSKWGRVIHIATAVATQPHAKGPDYSGAKAAMVNMTVSMAAALRGSGVTVNTVTPGNIKTDQMMSWAREMAALNGWGELTEDELEQRMVERNNLPAVRLGRVEDIAMVVCLLASPRSAFVTASNYRVDGGQVKSIN